MGKVFGVIIALACVFAMIGIFKDGKDKTTGVQRGLLAEAKETLAGVGLEFETGRQVDGVREAAVCGTASGQRFIHRSNALHPNGGLIVQSPRYPKPTFDALYAQWCGS